MIRRRSLSVMAIAVATFAIAACKSRAPEERVAPSAAAEDARAPGLGKDAIREVVETHHAALRRDCLSLRADAGDDAQWMLHVVVAEDGGVARVTAEGGDAAIGKCFEEHVARWSFPTGPATFDLPMRAKHEGR